jgi:hypothetical protein
MQANELREVAEPFSGVPGPTAEAFDPVLEIFKRAIDFTLVEKNLRLSTEERSTTRQRHTLPRAVPSARDGTRALNHGNGF